MRQLLSRNYSPSSNHNFLIEGCSFSCLNTRERIKEKVKAGEKTAKDLSAELKQIKHTAFLFFAGNEYLFLHASLRNLSDAIFSQAVQMVRTNLQMLPSLVFLSALCGYLFDQASGVPWR